MAGRGPSQCYVYYRVAADTPEARAAIGALIADIEARTGVAGRLTARCDDPTMWMEVYDPVRAKGAFFRALTASVRRNGAEGVAADGVRRVECFAGLRPPSVRRSKA